MVPANTCRLRLILPIDGELYRSVVLDDFLSSVVFPESAQRELLIGRRLNSRNVAFVNRSGIFGEGFHSLRDTSDIDIDLTQVKLTLISRL